MLGAILGDIVGSPYEFDHNNYKHKGFPLLSEKSHFTDDTVMTVAVAVGLIDGKGLPERTFCAVQHEMRFWGCEYPHAGIIISPVILCAKKIHQKQLANLCRCRTALKRPLFRTAQQHKIRKNGQR